jgi:23S rRNA (uracil1939-C5)-methyltransferase
MLKKGDRFTTVIASVAFGGEGVARCGEFVVFIPLAVDGDEVEAEVVAVRKRYARARILRLITPSNHRVEAPCPYYGRCGGCRMQHIAYAHQIEIKRQQVAETLTRIAKQPLPTVEAVIPSPRPLGYRGKAEFHVAGGPVWRTGLMALASHDLVEVEQCVLVDASINLKYRALKRLLQRSAPGAAGERQVIWSDGPQEPPADLAQQLLGQPEIERVVAGKPLAVPYQGFFQANLFLVEELVCEVVRSCALTGRETVIDAYGGVGLFSLFLGSGAARMVVIEGDAETVRCARRNLDREGLSRAEVLAGDVAFVLESAFLACGDGADVVVLDPPRDGCGEGVLAGVAALHPRRIVYVSCNPATLARDIGQLRVYGYLPRRLQPFDMFPQTTHIEVVALLTPR